MFQKKTIHISIILTLALSGASLRAQEPPSRQSVAPATLQQAFDMAWARQPEAQSFDARREAAEASLNAANSLTAEPPALELSGRTDQALQNDGVREYEAGVALPLWLPGERSRAKSLAEAESKAVGSRAAAARLRTAAAVREAWWQWLRAKGEQALSRERLESAQRLAGDVARRVKAGELAKADQHQAEGAAATAEAARAEADAALAASAQQLRAVIGVLPAEGAAESPETLPDVPDSFMALDARHPAVAELLDRAEAARRAADLARAQNRSNPELVLATTRDRDSSDDAWKQTVTLGVRFPFSSENRNRAKAGQAHAEAIETEGQLQLERERLEAQIEAARIQAESARAQLAATEKRAQLARESRAFFDKSFRLGESDLPTRLRIELEAAEAERQTRRARIEQAASISALRQAMGLLPEQK